MVQSDTPLLTGLLSDKVDYGESLRVLSPERLAVVSEKLRNSSEKGVSHVIFMTVLDFESYKNLSKNIKLTLIHIFIQISLKG